MFENAIINAACEKALKAISAGDKNALAVIYDNLNRLIYSVAWSVLNNREDAEDALQNTYCEILRSASGYKGGNAKAWVLSVARNQALNIARKRSRETPFEDFSEYETNHSGLPESEFIYLEALSNLSDGEREAVILKTYCRCRHKEIAELLGISVSAAEKLYQRGIARLREYYK